jgi:hypothetical protein
MHVILGNSPCSTEQFAVQRNEHILTKIVQNKLFLRKVATISDPDDTAARGVAPIRQFHKCDESKILPHKRLGLDLI